MHISISAALFVVFFLSVFAVGLLTISGGIYKAILLLIHRRQYRDELSRINQSADDN